jgi:Leucine-rich repeat (LRR) protein
MGKRREPTEAEKIAEQRALIKDALDTGKTELDLTTESMDVVREACAITTLKKLTLHTGKLDTLPKELGNLTALESFHIDGNELVSLPDSIGELDKVHTFYAYRNKFKKLPETFGGMKSIKKLVLWQNELTALPKSFGDLKKMTECEIKWNKIKELPDSINGLESLEDLDARSNKLTDLPKDLSGMKKLRRLNIGENEFTEFPEGLFTLPALVELDVSENKLKAIPDDIARLKKLSEINIEQNKIKELPKKLFSLPLVSLKMNQNQLGTLPKELAELPTLAELEIYGNPIKGIDDELSRKSKNEIFQALGLWKPRVALPAPADPEKSNALKKRATALEKFAREAKRRGGEKLVKLVAFLNGKGDEVPPPALDDEYHLSALTEALAPYKEWSFVDRRMLAFMTQDAWRFKHPGQDYFSGFDEGVFRWLEPQLEEEPEGSTLFADVAKEIQAFGVSEATILTGALHRIHDKLMKDGTATSFGRYVIDAAKRDHSFILQQDRDSVKEALIGLLVRNAKDLFAKVGDKLLVIGPDEDGDVHVPYDALDHACAMEPARFEKLVFEGLEKTTCDPCRAETARVLAKRYPQHKDKALEITKKTLARIAERKNKEERYQFYWSGGGHWEDGTAEYIEWALDTFGNVVKPDIDTLVEKTKDFSLDVAEVIAKRFGQSAIDTLAEGLQMTFDDDDIAPHFRRMFAMLAPLDWSKYHDKAWELARSEHKRVRETACLALARLDANVVLPKAKELLDAKRGHEREAGVMLLTLVTHPEAKKLLSKILDEEKSDDARDLVAKTFFANAPCDKKEAERRVQSAKARGKLDKPIAKWLDEKKLPKIASPEWLRFLFYRQTRQTEIAIDPEARGVFDLIDKKKTGDFAKKLLDLVVKNGGVAAKNRFALALVGVFGDAKVIETLETIAIDDRNENACRTLGLITTDAMDAARALDRIMKVYRVKYPNVRGAAEEAFDAIAERMGKTPFELADAMIPDFGMKNGRIVLKGLKNLFATIDDHQKVAIIDAKYQPAKAPPKTPVIKELQEAVKESARQLKNNLEYYLIVRRRWDLPAFSAFFETNPLAFSFARGFVWGSYEGAKLVQAFRVTKDAEHVGVDGKVVKLAKNAQIALVHPLEMDAAERAKWIAALAGAQIEPAFAQLDRPTFMPNDEERPRAKCFRFEDKELNSLTFKGRAERRGWRRGSVIDSGEVSAYRKVFPHDKIEVFIGTEGMNVTAYADAGEVTLKDLFFVRPGAVVTGSYTYDEPRDENDDRLIKLNDVPPIVFSEVVADLTAITKEKEEAEA